MIVDANLVLFMSPKDTKTLLQPRQSAQPEYRSTQTTYTKRGLGLVIVGLGIVNVGLGIAKP